MTTKFATVNFGSAASIVAQFAPWLDAKKPWDVSTMGPKPTAEELKLALQTQSGRKQKGTGTVMVRALLMRKDGATKAQRDAVMAIQGRGSCENDGCYGSLRKANWSGSSNDAPSTGRKLDLGTGAIVCLYPLGRSHWRTTLVKAADTTAPKAKAEKTTAKAPGKAKTATKAKGKAVKAKAAKAPVQAPTKAKASKANGKPKAGTPTAPVTPTAEAQAKAA